MGTVFLAEQIAVGNRPVALKVLLRKLLDDPEFLLRFQNEAASTGRIDHPNVVTIHESGQADDGTPYIAMQYLEGEPLRAALKARGALPIAETLEIIQQVARGLNAAHRLGIIHRDLKPDNIFLTRGDEDELVVKVVDFGIAKLREAATHTLTGTVLGTPAYMSFEQASGMRSDELDPRSDIYSLGVVVYEMLTGRVPFHSDTPLGYVRKHLSEDPPPFRAVKSDLPALPQLEGVVMRALAKDRDKRYSSVLEFARELAGAAQPQPAGEARATLPSTRVARPPVPLSASPLGSARAEAAVQTPPPMPPERIKPQVVGEGSPARSRVEDPGRAALPTYQIQATLEPPSRTKYILVGLLLVAAIIGAVWYFSQSRTKPPNVPETRGQSVPAGMVAISGGTFMMGRDSAEDPEETPAHSVTVPPFYLDKLPVTVSDYAKFAPARRIVGDPARPATDVNWNDAEAYCQSKRLRLPTEAEWEYAARGSDGRLYPWGNNFSPALTNSVEAGLRRLEAVGAHPDAASPFRILDMSGNVWQWTADDYKPYPGRKSAFEIPADAKVIRGGSFESDKNHVTTTARNLDHATSRSPIIGFRCAR